MSLHLHRAVGTRVQRIGAGRWRCMHAREGGEQTEERSRDIITTLRTRHKTRGVYIHLK